jgi:hypothetical protein
MLSNNYYHTRRKKVPHMLIAISAYNIVRGYHLIPKGNRSAAQSLQKERHQRSNNGGVLIQFRCTDDQLASNNDIDYPVEMWQTLHS